VVKRPVLALFYSFAQQCEKKRVVVFLSTVERIALNLYLRKLNAGIMYWTLELASHLEDAPWPATKEELIDYAIRSGAPLEVIENLQELEDDGEPYETIEEIWPDYPTKDDFFFNEDEY
jgi:hypothetical protein